MKRETRGVIRFAIRDLLEAKKRWPAMYSEDKILIMAISAAAMEEPEAAVAEVYQAVREELVRGLAEGTPSPALRATSPSGEGVETEGRREDGSGRI